MRLLRDGLCENVNPQQHVGFDTQVTQKQLRLRDINRLKPACVYTAGDELSKVGPCMQHG